MGFLGESASSLAAWVSQTAAGAWSPTGFFGSRWPNPKREFLSFGELQLIGVEEFVCEADDVCETLKGPMERLHADRTTFHMTFGFSEDVTAPLILKAAGLQEK